MKKEKKTKKLPVGIIDLDKMTGFDRASQEELIKWLEKEIEEYKKADSEFVKQNIFTEVVVAMINLAKKEGISLEKATGKLFKNFESSHKSR